MSEPTALEHPTDCGADIFGTYQGGDLRAMLCVSSKAHAMETRYENRWI